jgi:hypothetical protein
MYLKRILALALVVFACTTCEPPARRACKVDSDCGADFVCVNHGCLNIECSSSDDCSQPDVCIHGRCVACVARGKGCTLTTDCCEGLTCGANNTCGSCSKPGESCNTSNDCCNQTMCLGLAGSAVCQTK